MELVKKWGLVGLAGVCIGVGVGIILYANIGGDTITVAQDGIHVVLNISYGEASRLYNLVLIIMALVFSRKYFGLGSIVSALITSYLIDISNNWLVSLNLNFGFVVALIIFMIGLVIYTLGLALLIKCELGMNALDSLLYKFMDLTKIDYKWLRIVADLLLTVFGYLLGGVVGVGTIVSIALTGILVNMFSKIQEVH